MTSEAEYIAKDQVTANLGRFSLEKLLSQDQIGRRISLLGNIDSKPAIVVIERAAFPDNHEAIENVVERYLKHNVETIGANDIYAWFIGYSTESNAVQKAASVKINLIWPCTEKHITKSSAQGVRSVTETPEIYKTHVRPLMQKNREDGRLQWIYDILEGRAEQEDVMHRRVNDDDNAADEGFMLLPDLNWDRKHIPSLHVLGLCERRDIWSLRDLTKKHVPWLKHMRRKLIDATVKLYPQLEEDQLKLYVHYQPTYYHFHIHVVHVLLDSGTTQAVGKAIGLDGIIDQLERMSGEDDGMKDVTLTYSVGEASEFWLKIFEPLKRGKLRQGLDGVR